MIVLFIKTNIWILIFIKAEITIFCWNTTLNNSKQIANPHLFQHIPSIHNSTLYYNIGLQPYIVTDAVRIYPETFESAACFRVELVGCDPAGRWDGLSTGYQLFRLWLIYIVVFYGIYFRDYLWKSTVIFLAVVNGNTCIIAWNLKFVLWFFCFQALCPKDFCKNGGTCMGTNVCKCVSGFYGDSCDQSGILHSLFNSNWIQTTFLGKNPFITFLN